MAALPADVRLNKSTDHEPESHTQGRCAVCGKNTRIQCRLCKKRLHNDRGSDCFRVYHSEVHYKKKNQ